MPRPVCQAQNSPSFRSRNSLCDAEFMVGIPGTVGGALAMNAGCFGSETWEIVGHADTIKRNGEQTQKQRHQFKWGYRSVEKDSDEWFTGAQFQLTPCDSTQGRENIRRLLKDAFGNATDPDSQCRVRVSEPAG